jgi:hypothetical protein
MSQGFRKVMDWDNILPGLSNAGAYNSQLFMKNWKTRSSAFRDAFKGRDVDGYLTISYHQQILFSLEWLGRYSSLAYQSLEWDEMMIMMTLFNDDVNIETM